ncbi:response regulator transcription factor [bacterium]|nr:response regulator transcription factor [bacterium]
MSNFLDIFNKQYFPPEKDEDFVLRKSQIELLNQLAKGDTIKETAERMNLKYYNLQKRTQLLYKKFNVKTRKELISKAIKYKIIKTSAITPKFRKRFLKNMPVEIEPLPTKPRFKLEDDEITLLKLSATGATRKEITKQMHLYNVYAANCIASRACYNLYASNITQAVAIAKVLNLI